MKINKALYQLREYMKYNGLENSLIHKNIESAFKLNDFRNIYLDEKTYPILKQQIFKLICEYGESNVILKPYFW